MSKDGKTGKRKERSKEGGREGRKEGKRRWRGEGGRGNGGRKEGERFITQYYPNFPVN